MISFPLYTPYALGWLFFINISFIFYLSKKKKKNREERVLYALKRGKKTGSPTEKRKGVKKKRRNREERVLYALKVWTMTNLP